MVSDFDAGSPVEHTSAVEHNDLSFGYFAVGLIALSVVTFLSGLRSVQRL